ncbi:MAG: hypothetical protein R3240_09945, partial [Gammaproteobacteria bacterium]|nr:hypothetical protein [Gammaproteobacteria bacterium]
LEAYTKVRLANTVELVRRKPNDGIYQNLDQLLADTADLLWQLSDWITQTYFSHVQSSNMQVSTPIEDEV